MLTLRSKTDEHDMEIWEGVVNGKVYSLDFCCHTCDTIVAFPNHQYPKYRLAMAAAQECAKEHTGLDSLTWHL